jgi:hypothetical protein
MGRNRAVVLTFLQGMAVIVAVAVYVPKTRHPFRENLDSVEYRQMSDSIAAGRGFLPWRFPQGYPLVVAGLTCLGIGDDRCLATLNLLTMTAGLLACRAICRSELGLGRIASNVVALLPLATWVFLFYVGVAPATEFPYFAVSMAALLCDCKASRDARWLIPACVASTIAVSIRTAGVALLLPLLWAMFRNSAVRSVVVRASIVVLLLAALSVGAVRISRTEYVEQIRHNLSEFTPTQAEARIMNWRLTELSEIVMNFRRDIVPWPLRYDLPILGAIFLALVGAGAWSARSSPAAVYLAAYVTMLFVWPFGATRFWLPVMPLLFAFALIGAQRLWQLRRKKIVDRAIGSGSAIPAQNR